MKKILISILFISLVTSLALGQEVKICDDKAEWPPYMYYERVNGKINKKKIVGAVIELFDQAFKLTDLTYSMQLLPWKRCLVEVENFGTRHGFEVFSNGSYSPQKAKKYWPSIPLYVTHQGVWYSTKKYPQGPPIKKKSDLARYKICGVFGNDYSDLLQWDKKIKIDQGAKSNDAVLKKIDRGRCDIMIASIEPIYGAEAVGQFKIPKGIKSFPMPGLKANTFHFWVSKQSPRGPELLAALNTAITDVIYSQDYKKIFTKHLPHVSPLYE